MSTPPPSIVRIVLPAPREGDYIVQAAVVHDGRVYLGWRHSTPLMWLIKNAPNYNDDEGRAQGFVDQYGYFWSREQSAIIAAKAGQIKEAGDVLISEELWSDKGLIYRMPRPLTSCIATLIHPEF